MFSNLNKTLKKVIIIFLVIALTYSNFVLVGSSVMKGLFSYALDDTEQALEDKVTTEQELVTNKVCEINKELKRVVQIAVTTGITEQAYPIKTTSLTLKTNIIEETLEDVKVTSLNKNSYTTGTWEIKDEKLQITLVNENETLENKDEGLDKLLVTYIYSNNEENPIEQIEKPIEQIALQTYANESVTKNIETSNFEDIEKETDILLLNIENKDIHKTSITDGRVDYTEKLNLDLSYRGEIANIEIEDISNDFYDTEELISEEASLKYLKTKIDKNMLVNLLGAEGKLTITDINSNKILAEITKEYIETQELNTKIEQNFEEEIESLEGEETTKTTQTRTYITITEADVEIEYALEVNKIQIKIENIVKQSDNNIQESNFVIENTKSIFDVQDSDKLNYLKENVKYTLGEAEKTADSKITFKDTITRATLETDKTELTIGEVNKVNYTITLDTETPKSELFVNPVLLVELPSSVASVNAENSEFSIKNNNGAFTNKEVFPATVLGKQYVAIILTGEQTAESVANGNTQIVLSLELNVKAEADEGNETAKLYYQNNTVTAYESGASFDTAEIDVTLVLENENKEEIVENEEKIDMQVFVSSYSEGKAIKQGEQIEYNIYIYNYKQSEIENIEVMDILPEGVELEKVVEIFKNEETLTYNIERDINYIYNEDTRTLLISADKIDAATNETIGTRTFKIVVKTNELKDCYSKTIKNSVVAKVDKKEIVSNEVVVTVSDKFLDIETQEIDNQIYEGQILTFKTKVTNRGLIDAKGLEYELQVPSNIKLSTVKYGIINENNEEIIEGNGAISDNKYKQTFIDILAGKTFYIEFSGTVEQITEENKETVIPVVIEGNIDGQEFSWETKIINPNNPEEPNEPEKPSAPEEPNNPEQPTNPEEPNNPENPSEPEEPQDSDNKAEFDLSLNQYLNKVIVENSQGTTTYDYTNTNFAKVEIPAKYMNGSKVTFEYKIIVKNEGTISGYARKIVDYLPKDLTFSEEQNKDWYVGEDGNIYSVALIDKLLEPGDSEELTIILTKQMNNNNTGTVTNIAEIYEASNDENVEDINSIPGDKLEDQNDMSKVEVILAVRTGTIILYILLVITVITIIGIGIYKVKKITLNKKGGC
ncbi:MAG: hypothetical protein ACI4VP_04945 [Clostridia bacterium]